MTVLIAMDKFKDSITAGEACQAVAKGIKKAGKEIKTIVHPVADGGEGSLEVIAPFTGARKIEVNIKGPRGNVSRSYYLLKDTRAYIELALASGLQMLPPAVRNPLFTSTIGTGMLIKDAIGRGAKEIYLFVGGSATNDAGTGILSELGYKFYDKKGQSLFPAGLYLSEIETVDTSGVIIPPDIKMYVLTDVQNTLYGKQGAALVYAMQKGASKEDAAFLDYGLKHFAGVIKRDFQKDIANIKGGGAAGGVPAGLSAFMDVEIRSGIKEILKITNFEKDLDKADTVITGEGKVDLQSLSGKAVSEVVKRAKAKGKNIALFAGSIDHEIAGKLEVQYYDAIVFHAKDMDDALINAKKWLEQMGYDYGRKQL